MSDSENKADIVARLRDWRSLHLTRLGELFDEAADEIERLRSRPCPYVTGAVTQHCTLTPFTLTDAEREAVEDAIGWIESPSVEDEAMPEDYLPITATLRGLLERCSQFAKRESDRPQPIAKRESDRSKPIATPSPLSTPAEGSVPTERT